jgi:drug/metabolite transporter (DMT)-like permease
MTIAYDGARTFGSASPTGRRGRSIAFGWTVSSTARGIACALVTVLIWSGWPIYTRFSVGHTLAPEDLVALRYTVGGLILLPVLLRGAGTLSGAQWSQGLFLAICQGAPLAILITVGVRFAPASHYAVLTPGLLPLFAALIGMLWFGEQVTGLRKIGLALISLGALTLAGAHLAFGMEDVSFGHLLFICAAMMGAVYAVCLRRSGLSPLLGVALVTIYSMIFYLPGYAALASSRIWTAPPMELLLQAIYQGVLVAAVSLIAFNRAIVLLGAARASAFLALVPALTALAAIPLLGEIPSAWDAMAVVAIAAGVWLAAGLSPGITWSSVRN